MELGHGWVIKSNMNNACNYLLVSHVYFNIIRPAPSRSISSQIWYMHCNIYVTSVVRNETTYWVSVSDVKYIYIYI